MLKVLVCDDEAHIANGLRYFLESQGYQVRVAYDGDEALRQVEADIPDLLILDVMMPRKSGFEVVAELRARQAMQGTIIAMLTARGQEEDVQYARDLGVTEFISKPFSLLDLSSRIAKLLAAREEQAEPSSTRTSM